MHPIERLRAVARADGVPQDRLVAEAAVALSAFASQPAALVTAARQVVSRQVTVAGMWSLAARMLASDDPWSTATSVLDAIDADATVGSLEYALGEYDSVLVDAWSPTLAAVLLGADDLLAEIIDVDARGDMLAQQLNARGVEVWSWSEAHEPPIAEGVQRGPYVVELVAVGPGVGLAPWGSGQSMERATAAGRDVWAIGGAGRVLPREMFDALVARSESEGELDRQGLEVVSLDGVDSMFGASGQRSVAEETRATDCPVAPELYRAPKG